MDEFKETSCAGTGHVVHLRAFALCSIQAEFQSEWESVLGLGLEPLLSQLLFSHVIMSFLTLSLNSFLWPPDPTLFTFMNLIFSPLSLLASLPGPFLSDQFCSIPLLPIWSHGSGSS